MAKVKINKKAEKIEKTIKLLKEKEKARIDGLKKSVSLCIDRLFDKKQFSLIFIGSNDLGDTIITPCYVKEFFVNSEKSIELKVDFVLGGENHTIVAPFYDVKAVNYKDESVMMGICENENDCKKIYNHFLDLRIKHINGYRMKIN